MPIGEAFVAIEPDASGFEQAVRSTVERSLAALRTITPVTIPVNTEELTRRLNELPADLQALTARAFLPEGASPAFTQGLRDQLVTALRETTAELGVSLDPVMRQIPQLIVPGMREVAAELPTIFGPGGRALSQQLSEQVRAGLSSGATGALSGIVTPALERELRAAGAGAITVPTSAIRSSVSSVSVDAEAQALRAATEEAAARMEEAAARSVAQEAESIRRITAATEEAAARSLAQEAESIKRTTESAVAVMGEAIASLDRSLAEEAASIDRTAAEAVTRMRQATTQAVQRATVDRLAAASVGDVGAAAGLGGIGERLAQAARGFGTGLAGAVQTASRATGPLRDGLIAIDDQVGSRLRSVVAGAGGLVAEGITRGGGAITGALRGTIEAGFQTAGLVGAGLLAVGLREALKGITLGSQLQGVRNTLTELTGSVESADSAIATLQATSVQTGQAFQPLADGAKQLVAVGISASTAVPALSAVADFVTVFSHGTASSAQGIQRATLALQEMGLQGTVQAKFLRQLVNDGVPAYRILVDAATKAGVKLGQNDAALLKASAAEDAVTKATLSLETAQQSQADALAKHGLASGQYADATRRVESAQISLRDAQDRATVATKAADQALTDGHGQVAAALKAGKISAQAYYAALADPKQLAPILNVIGSLNDNLVFSLNRLRAGLSTGAGKLFEPIQSGLAQAVSGIVAPLQRLVEGDALPKLGQQIAQVLPVASMQAAAAAVGNLLDKIGKLGSSAVPNAIAKLRPMVPVLAALGGAVAGVGLRFAGSLPLIGALVPGAFGPLLGAIAALVLAVPQLRSRALDLAESLGHSLFGALQELEPLLTPVTDWLTAILNGAQPIINFLGRDLTVAVRDLVPILSQLADWLGRGIVEGEHGAASALAGLAPQIDTASRVLSTIVQYVERLVSDVGTALANSLPTLKDALSGVPWNDLADALDRLLPLLITLGTQVLKDVLANLDPVVRLLADMTTNLLDLTKATKGANQDLGPLAPILADIFTLLIALAAARWVISLIVNLGKAALAAQAFVLGFVGAFGALAEAIGTVGIIVALFLGLPIEAGVAIVVAAIVLVVALGVAIYLLVTHWDQVKAAAMGAYLWMAQASIQFGQSILNLLALIGEAIGRFWDMVGTWVHGLPDRLASVDWKSVGLNIILGIAAGMTMGASELVFGGVIDDVLGWVKDRFHSAGKGHSPYRFFYPVGENVVGGVVEGMQLAGRTAAGAAQSLLTSMAVALGDGDVRLGASLPVLAGALASGAGVQPASVINITVNVSNPGSSAQDIAEEIGWRLSRMGLAR